MITEDKYRTAGVPNEEIGVVWVQTEAEKLGYQHEDREWANFGQGEPEVGELRGGSPRIKKIQISPGDDRYGPVNGITELREVIAAYYNRLYRKQFKSLYTYKNVSIAMGGRAALSRIFTSAGRVRMGYRNPEYPAYHDLFNLHADKIIPVCIESRKENNFSILPCEFQAELRNNQLDTFLFSNPCNPTGHVLRDSELMIYLESAKRENCAMIVDEFYSHYIYDDDGKPVAEPVSASAFIDDVNADGVLIVDGLTKSFRYPGWRLAWTLGSERAIADLGRVASAIDGGPSIPIQRAAIPLFRSDFVDKETTALREVFSRKKNIMVSALRTCGISSSRDSNGTFYVWGDISKLPYPLNDSTIFFREALKRKVIIVPGYLFDICPGSQQGGSSFSQFVRFSFGTEEENLVSGLARISELIKSFSFYDTQG